MILGVNGIRLTGNRSGVSRAIEAVLLQMDYLDHPFDSIRVYSPTPIANEIKLPKIAEQVVVPSVFPPSLWEQFCLPLAHKRHGVLFCPSYVVPIFALCPLVLVHHGSYEGYKDANLAYSWWARTKAKVAYMMSAHRANAVSTVSNFSRLDMKKYYHISVDRIRVIPEGVDVNIFQPIDDMERLGQWRKKTLGSDSPFLLYVGKPTLRRNLPNLLRAFAGLDVPHKLVLIGTALPGTSFESLINELGINDRVVTVPYANHEEIAIAYNAADIFIYPSSYEGFGMPVLEAMACGAPVITLDNTAFPEFSDGVAWLLKDADVNTLASAITNLLSDVTERTRMKADGPVRAAEYNWPIIAKQYLDMICSVTQFK